MTIYNSKMTSIYSLHKTEENVKCDLDVAMYIMLMSFYTLQYDGS